jgi:AraC-like DNA-binding protein
MHDRIPTSNCLISTHVRHRLATVTVRSDVLIWVRGGTKTLHNPRETLEVSANGALAVAQGAQWDITNDPMPHGRYEALILQFGDDVLHEFDRRYKADFLFNPLADSMKISADAELCQTVLRATDTLGVPSASTRMKQHRVMEVLLLLAERGCVFHSTDEVSWPDKVRRLVSQRPHEDWSLEQVANCFHMSASTLQRRLREFDVTVGDLVRETRLEVALMLLQSTSMPVGEVAQRCGYDSHSRFSAAFRTRYGFLPSYLRSAD